MFFIFVQTFYKKNDFDLCKGTCKCAWKFSFLVYFVYTKMTFCELTLWAPTDHYIHGKWIFWSHKMTIFCSKKVQMLSKNTTWSWRCFVLPNTRSVSKNPKTCTKKVFGHSKKQSKQFCSVNILTVNDKNSWFSVSENCQKAWLFGFCCHQTWFYSWFLSFHCLGETLFLTENAIFFDQIGISIICTDLGFQ